jgi:hypothetical protein
MVNRWKAIPGEQRGLMPTPRCGPTPLRNNTSPVDPVGGSVSFYDTRVRLVKI